MFYNFLIAELFELNDLLNTTLLQYHETMLSIKKSNLVNTRKISPTLTCNTICDYSTLLDLNSPIEDVPFILPTQPIELKGKELISTIFLNRDILENYFSFFFFIQPLCSLKCTSGE